MSGLSESRGTRSGVFAYARWQLLDYFYERSITTVVIAVLLGFPFVLAVRHATTFGAGTGLPGMDSLMMTGLSTIVAQLAPLATFLAINKMVAGDRLNGYYRFLFAKPIAVHQYYAQLFVMHGVGIAIVSLVIVLIARAFDVPVPAFRTVAVFLMTYIALGGMGFFLSVLSRYDWQIMVGIWFLSRALTYRYGEAGGIAQALVHTLPPVHLVGELISGILGGHSWEFLHLVWLLGYGILCFVIGLVALRYRQLAS